MGGIKGWYKSLSSSGFGGSNDYGYHPLKFNCMNCGKEHNKIACPRCGSKAVRVFVTMVQQATDNVKTLPLPYNFIIVNL